MIPLSAKQISLDSPFKDRFFYYCSSSWARYEHFSHFQSQSRAIFTNYIQSAYENLKIGTSKVLFVYETSSCTVLYFLRDYFYTTRYMLIKYHDKKVENDNLIKMW